MTEPEEQPREENAPQHGNVETSNPDVLNPQNTPEDSSDEEPDNK